MKKFHSEFGHNYKTYSFSYANYCVKEKKDKLADIYAAGYLPYSGSPGVKDVFYMARSARVPLTSLKFSSENRRVAGKFDPVRLVRQSTAFKNFNVKDKNFMNFCVDYFTKRHGSAVMPKERLETLFNADLITHIVSYHRDEKPAAYVLEVGDKDMVHFWYSFYDTSLIHQSLGMWLMLDSARNAKNAGKKYFYIGTVYGEKALYKTAFENIEFWNGQEWVADKRELKKLGRSDSKKTVNFIDDWKREIKIF